MRSLSGASSISAPFVSRASRAIDVAWAQVRPGKVVPFPNPIILLRLHATYHPSPGSYSAINALPKQLVHRVLPVDPFFIDGWGNLEAVHWETDKEFFNADPPELQVSSHPAVFHNLSILPASIITRARQCEHLMLLPEGPPYPLPHLRCSIMHHYSHLLYG